MNANMNTKTHSYLPSFDTRSNGQLMRASNQEKQAASFVPNDGDRDRDREAMVKHRHTLLRYSYTAPSNPSYQHPQSIKMRSAKTEMSVKSGYYANMQYDSYQQSSHRFGADQDRDFDLDPDSDTELHNGARIHFETALRHLPDFQLTKQMVMPNYLSPRHQPCVHPLMALAANPLGKPADDRLFSSYDDKSSIGAVKSGKYTGKKKSQYMWVDTFKQWVEVDNLLVPYINFIRSMRLNERDIQRLEQLISKHGKDVDVCQRFLEHFKIFDSRHIPEKLNRPGERQTVRSSNVSAYPPIPVDTDKQLTKEEVENDRPKPRTEKRREKLALIAHDNQEQPESTTKTPNNDVIPINFGEIKEPKRRTTHLLPVQQSKPDAGSQKSTRERTEPPQQNISKPNKANEAQSLLRRFSRLDLKPSSESTSARVQAPPTSIVDYVKRPTPATSATSATTPRKQEKVKSAKKSKKSSSSKSTEIADDMSDEEESVFEERRHVFLKPITELEEFMTTYLTNISAEQEEREGVGSERRDEFTAVKPIPKQRKQAIWSICESTAPGFEFDGELVEDLIVITGADFSNFVPDARPDKRLERINSKLLLRESPKRDTPKQAHAKRPQGKAQAAVATIPTLKPKAKPKSAREEDAEDKKVTFNEDLVVKIEEPVVEAVVVEEVVPEPAPAEKEPKYPLLLPKLKAQLEHKRKKPPKPKLDTSYADELERQRRAEAIKLKFREMLDSTSHKSVPSPMTGSPNDPIFDDYGWLAQFCIFNSGILDMYRRAFDSVDENNRGWLKPDECIVALRGVNAQLANSEQRYLFRVVELLGRGRRLGIDFKLFSVIAGLAQRLASLDNWMRALVNKTDLAGLEMKLVICLKLWEFAVDKTTKKLPIDKLCLELKAGGVSAEHEEEVRHRLGWMKALDILDYLTYMPLFIMIHQSVVENPLIDERNK